MPFREKAHLMTDSEIDRTLVHLAHDIVDKTDVIEDLVFIGVLRRGVFIAERLAQKISQKVGTSIPVGSLDVERYRDDRPDSDTARRLREPQISFPITGTDVVLVDDVLFTGRTTRAALDALFDHGRPRRVRLCVLIDRGHRELPIEAGFVGKRLEADPGDVIEVKLREEDEIEKVLILEKVETESAS